MKYTIKRVILNKKNVETLTNLDAACFPSDYRLTFKNRNGVSVEYWWIVYNELKKPIGFAGFKYNNKRATFIRAGVLENYRNNGIHKKLIKIRLKYAKQLMAKEVLTYTSIDNNNSFNNLVRLGFNLFKWKEDIGGIELKDTIFLWFKIDLV